MRSEFREVLKTQSILGEMFKHSMGTWVMNFSMRQSLSAGEGVLAEDGMVKLDYAHRST
jgi:hypothetical protein